MLLAKGTRIGDWVIRDYVWDHPSMQRWSKSIRRDQDEEKLKTVDG